MSCSPPISSARVCILKALAGQAEPRDVSLLEALLRLGWLCAHAHNIRLRARQPRVRQGLKAVSLRLNQNHHCCVLVPGLPFTSRSGLLEIGAHFSGSVARCRSILYNSRLLAIANIHGAMRLLNVQTDGTISLRNVSQSQECPAYAILSHTWDADDEEVSFSEFQSLPREELECRTGYRKVTSAASQAIKDGYSYFWIDTICIDKSNSNEVSEAINSMFHWYRRASVCYAYLSDVPPDDSVRQLSPKGLEICISQSRWFTRGWTLQELIAPLSLQFLDRQWNHLGSRENLMHVITRTTGIPTQVCLDASSTTHFSVAQKMSWAANRRTTRPEDMAYSLLGIFGVNIPILYGEGSKSFIRLQEEIIRVSSDHSIFAWEGLDDAELQVGSVLAEHPSAFARSTKIVLDSERRQELCVLSFRSLLMRLPVITPKLPWKHEKGLYAIALLPCKSTDDPLRLLGLPLTKLASEQAWKRIWGRTFGFVNVGQAQAKRAEIQTIELDVKFQSLVDPKSVYRLQYHGKVNFANLLWDDWNRPTQDEQQTLWNFAVRKVMTDFQFQNGASDYDWVALTISVAEIERRDRAKATTGQTAFERSQQVPGDVMLEAPSNATLNAVVIAPSTQSPPNNSTNHSEGLCFRRRELDSNPTELVRTLDFLPGEACSHGKGVPESGLLRKPPINQNDRVCSPACGRLLNMASYDYIENVEKLTGFELEFQCGKVEQEGDEEGDKNGDEGDQNEGIEGGKEEEDGNESENVEHFDEEEDCESVFSDIQFDDTSSIASFSCGTTDETLLLDLWVEAIVDIILERYGTMSRIEDKMEREINKEHSQSNRAEVMSSAEHMNLHRGCKRKSDHDSCDEGRHSRARSE